MDPLTEEQRQRIAVLYATQEALRLELMPSDLIRLAHWVQSGRDLMLDDSDAVGDDAATWIADLDEPEQPPTPPRVQLDPADYATPRRPRRRSPDTAPE